MEKIIAKQPGINLLVRWKIQGTGPLVNRLRPGGLSDELLTDLRRRFGHGIGFCGNMDVMLWASGDRDAIRRAVLTKLNAAKGGGFIFQSDHSVPGNIAGEDYDYVVNLVRKHGVYPLQLGEFDLADLN